MSSPLGSQNQKIPIDDPQNNPFEFFKGLIFYFYVKKYFVFFQKNVISNFMGMSQILKHLWKKMAFTSIRRNS